MMTWSCKIKKKQIQELAITPRYHVELGARSDSQRQQMWGGWGEESRARDGSSVQKPHLLQKNGAQVTWTACYLRTSIVEGEDPAWYRIISRDLLSLTNRELCEPRLQDIQSQDRKLTLKGNSESCVVWPGHNFQQESQYFPKCPSIPLKEVTRCPWLLTQMLTFPWWTICVIPLLWGPWVFVKCHDVLCSRCDLLL